MKMIQVRQRMFDVEPVKNSDLAKIMPVTTKEEEASKTREVDGYELNDAMAKRFLAIKRRRFQNAGVYFNF